MTPRGWRLESKANYLRTRTEGTVRARRFTGQVRAARKIGERAELFARGTYLRNTFAGLDHSVDGAAGVTAILFHSDRQRFSFDLGMRHQWEFSRRNRISNDASLKADVERSSDWRVSHVASLEASLNAVLALKLSHEVNYRNEPVPGFTRADTVAAAAIVATF